MKIHNTMAMGMAAVLMAGAGNVAMGAPMKEKQTDRPAILFLVAGQSNAGGCGIYSPEQHEELGRAKKRPLVPGSTALEVGLSTDAADYTHSYIWMPDEGFQRLDPAVNTRPITPGSKMHGMELPVVAELEKRFPDNDIYVVKLGPSGANLHHDWNPERTDGFYARWIKCYREGITVLNAEYPEIRVVGLYWDQGESDKRKADEYPANLANMMATFRRDTGLPHLKIFIRKHLYDFRNVDQIVAAQEKVVAEDPYCYLLDIDLGRPEANYEAWSYSPNNIHLSSKAFVELTRLLFDGPLHDATLASFDLYPAK